MRGGGGSDDEFLMMLQVDDGLPQQYEEQCGRQRH
jgi:hypothetical protein